MATTYTLPQVTSNGNGSHMPNSKSATSFTLSDDSGSPTINVNFDDEEEEEPGRFGRVLRIVLRALALMALLYTFVCSLSFLSSSFRLLGGKAAGKIISKSELLQNPIVGLMIGVLVTVLVQSSSTSTSIVVTMVGSDLIRVKQAIPIIMGANIGTSVTNTIVSLMQASDRNEFRLAFAAATVHDMFNWLTVIVLLPLEVFFGVLEAISDKLMSMQEWKTDHASSKPKFQFLQKLTKPITDSVLKLDKSLLNRMGVAAGNSSSTSDDDNEPLLQQCCKKELVDNITTCTQPCTALLNRLELSDNVAGIILLVFSLVTLCTCLILIVKLLHSILRGRIAIIIKKYINSDYAFPYSAMIGYLAILVGCLMTILVQSSSVFTSALTPLAGIGVISIERIYPLTLGSNIGTTTTGILAALAADGRSLRNTLQLAFCHLLFNIFGILIFYPIPFMRVPITLAKILGSTTSKYRWFSILYLLLMFFLMPLIVFTLSWAGKWYFIGIGGPIALLLAAVTVINVIQAKRPSWLPLKLQNWNFLPLWMHSLDPIDKLILKFAENFSCLGCCIQPESRHDGDALGMRANQSQLHILDAAKFSSEPQLSCLDLQAYDNTACYVTWHNGNTASSHHLHHLHLHPADNSKAESTHL